MLRQIRRAYQKSATVSCQNCGFQGTPFLLAVSGLQRVGNLCAAPGRTDHGVELTRKTITGNHNPEPITGDA